MPFKFNPIESEFDLVGTDGYIPELTSDPVSPTPETAWVLRSGGFVGGGVPVGLLLGITTAGSGSFSYELRYRTLENSTIGVVLS